MQEPKVQGQQMFHNIKSLRLFIFFVSFFLGAVVANAQEASPSLKILKATTTIGASESVLMGLSFDLPSGWSLYAPFAGSDAPFPALAFEGSQNVDALTLLWPPATKEIKEGIPVATYHDMVVLPLVVSVMTPAQDASLKLTVDYVACYHHQCFPFTASFDESLSAGALHPTVDAPGLEDALLKSGMVPILIESPATPTWSEICMLLGGAFLGGIILNFMPCVLPVLSLKMLRLLKKKSRVKDDEYTKVKSHFFATFLGILSFFILFGLMSTILQWFGSTLSWGAHFQSPFFLILMIGILILFGLNLWGFFELELPEWMRDRLGKTLTLFGSSKKDGSFIKYSGDFATGFLTAVLASPCTAPFLGTVLGFSLLQTGFISFSIFVSIGGGLGLPYILAILFPGFLKFLPSPGPWMSKLKKFLSLGLFGTALWLLTVLCPSLLPVMANDGHQLGWREFSQSAIQNELKKGNRVLVDVTADWCLTCKANKVIAFNNVEVQKTLSAKDLVLMRADWTRPDPNIERYLRQFSRSGIPMTVYYNIKHPNGNVLPELLTPRILQETINNTE